MLKVVCIMVAGIVTGALLRKRNLRLLPHIIMMLILLLLLLLGISVGNNESVMGAFDTIGVSALVITIFAVLGSASAAYFIYKYFFKQ